MFAPSLIWSEPCYNRGMPNVGRTSQGLGVFISYPGKDGLDKAKQAEILLKQSGHRPWLYEQHKTLGATLFREIAICIRKKSHVLLYICTGCSLGSWGQQLEAGYALSNRSVKIIVVSLDNAQVPDELTAFNYEIVSSNEFQKRLQVIANNLPTIVDRIQRLDEETKLTITSV